MIVKNEAQRIGAAIRSVQRVPAINDVVVLDTGSTDETRLIAADLGARVIEGPWQGFADTRNECIEYCRNDWVVTLDGDEILSRPGDLSTFLEQDPSDTDGAAVRVQCIGAAGGKAESLVSIRAHRRSRGRWQFPVHNVLVGLKAIAVVDAEIEAYYDSDLDDATHRRLQVLLEHHKADPEEIHYLFYIAKGYRVLGDHGRVIEWGDRYFDIAGADTSGSPSVLHWMAESHLALGDAGEAEELLRLGLQKYPGYPDLHHLEIAFAMQKWIRSASRVRQDFVAMSMPLRTQHLVRNAPEAAELLGLPLTFNYRQDAPGGADDG